MLIAILGLPQTGKATLANHLTTAHSFTRVHIAPSSPPATGALSFPSSSDFLDYATRNWRKDFVTTDLRSRTKLVEFSKRPFVVIVGVEAPLRIRYRRAVAAAQDDGLPIPSLESFVTADDLSLYGLSPSSSPSLSASTSPGPPSTPQKSLTPRTHDPPSPTPSPSRPRSPLPPPNEPLAALLHLSTRVLPNPYFEFEPFLASLDLPALEAALRPPWDSYFMLLASLASLRSNCMKRRVGAVLVRERRVVSTGYNGTPRGVSNCSEGGCGRCNHYGDGLGGSEKGKMVGMGEGLDECLCLHAEENALLEAGRERVSGGGTEGAVLYCNTCPCLRCTVKIVQCGVREVVYSLSYSMDAASRRVMEESGVGLRQIEMPDFPRG